MPDLDFEALYTRARREFRLKSTLHGPDHWRRVEVNGLALAPHTGADIVVVRLFAIFHDCKRQDDMDDPEHGRRAATFLAEQRTYLFDIPDEVFALLREAIAHHADGTTHHDPTIGTCWDADRLDLTRCGMVPSPDFFSTRVGREAAEQI